MWDKGDLGIEGIFLLFSLYFCKCHHLNCKKLIVNLNLLNIVATNIFVYNLFPSDNCVKRYFAHLRKSDELRFQNATHKSNPY